VRRHLHAAEAVARPEYGAPSVRGRQIFGDGGLVSKDWTYPVWRAGANAAPTGIKKGGD
jgi:hypothetical protein